MSDWDQTNLAVVRISSTIFSARAYVHRTNTHTHKYAQTVVVRFSGHILTHSYVRVMCRIHIHMYTSCASDAFTCIITCAMTLGMLYCQFRQGSRSCLGFSTSNKAGCMNKNTAVNTSQIRQSLITNTPPGLGQRFATFE